MKNNATLITIPKLTFRYGTDADEVFFHNKLLEGKDNGYLGFHGVEVDIFKNNKYKVSIVVLADDKLAGFTILSSDDLVGFDYIDEIYILKEFRRNGIGTKLLEFAEDYCKKNWNGKGIDLYTLDNDPMELIVKKAGFKFSGYYKKKGFRHGKLYGQKRWFKLYE